MTVKSASIAIGLALVLAGGVASVASAQSADGPDSQRPPADQQAPADQQTQQKPDCVKSNTDFKQNGKAATFVIELQNSCEMRLKCTVDAYVVGARGPAQGHATLILAPKSKGAAATKAYVMKVKSAGGMANVSHACKAI